MDQGIAPLRERRKRCLGRKVELAFPGACIDGKSRVESDLLKAVGTRVPDLARRHRRARP
jgi:hypothetical protein